MSRRRGQSREVPNWLPREPALNPWIDQNMRRIQSDSDNADNERVAEVDNVEDEATYEQIHADGCCGFVDLVLTHRASGRRFRFGFNYGH